MYVGPQLTKALEPIFGVPPLPLNPRDNFMVKPFSRFLCFSLHFIITVTPVIVCSAGTETLRGCWYWNVRWSWTNRNPIVIWISLVPPSIVIRERWKCCIRSPLLPIIYLIGVHIFESFKTVLWKIHIMWMEDIFRFVKLKKNNLLNLHLHISYSSALHLSGPNVELQKHKFQQI